MKNHFEPSIAGLIFPSNPLFDVCCRKHWWGKKREKIQNDRKSIKNIIDHFLVFFLGEETWEKKAVKHLTELNFLLLSLATATSSSSIGNHFSTFFPLALSTGQLRHTARGETAEEDVFWLKLNFKGSSNGQKIIVMWPESRENWAFSSSFGKIIKRKMFSTGMIEIFCLWVFKWFYQISSKSRWNLCFLCTNFLHNLLLDWIKNLLI